LPIKVSNLLPEAKQIFAVNSKSEIVARDFMTSAQLDVLAEDFASWKQLLTVTHFHLDAEKREFDHVF
jgi:hypothetical protein